MLLSTVVAAFLAAAVGDQNEQKLLTAAWIEWGVAHCSLSEIPASIAMMANMVIGGSDKVAVEAARSQVAEGIKAAHPDNSSACAEITSTLKK